ncbi:hypothetical protein [Oceanisphaera psychrotolerans]|uniref:hypothetical protein n=1 Tax=Oceanisphaera psychrotolerans TaxID=1414654 RepID=UPI001113896F|nr:hypothetical protein [Oceanisphaera psychrotolerans]
MAQKYPCFVENMQDSTGLPGDGNQETRQSIIVDPNDEAARQYGVMRGVEPRRRKGGVPNEGFGIIMGAVRDHNKEFECRRMMR